MTWQLMAYNIYKLYLNQLQIHHKLLRIWFTFPLGVIISNNMQISFRTCTKHKYIYMIMGLQRK